MRGRRIASAANSAGAAAEIADDDDPSRFRSRRRWWRRRRCGGREIELGLGETGGLGGVGKAAAGGGKQRPGHLVADCQAFCATGSDPRVPRTAPTFAPSPCSQRLTLQCRLDIVSDGENPVVAADRQYLAHELFGAASTISTPAVSAARRARVSARRPREDNVIERGKDDNEAGVGGAGLVDRFDQPLAECLPAGFVDASGRAADPGASSRSSQRPYHARLPHITGT